MGCGGSSLSTNLGGIDSDGIVSGNRQGINSSNAQSSSLTLTTKSGARKKQNDHLQNTEPERIGADQSLTVKNTSALQRDFTLLGDHQGTLKVKNFLNSHHTGKTILRESNPVGESIILPHGSEIDNIKGPSAINLKGKRENSLGRKASAGGTGTARSSSQVAKKPNSNRLADFEASVEGDDYEAKLEKIKSDDPPGLLIQNADLLPSNTLSCVPQDGVRILSPQQSSEDLLEANTIFVLKDLEDGNQKYDNLELVEPGLHHGGYLRSSLTQDLAGALDLEDNEVELIHSQANNQSAITVASAPPEIISVNAPIASQRIQNVHTDSSQVVSKTRIDEDRTALTSGPKPVIGSLGNGYVTSTSPPQQYQPLTSLENRVLLDDSVNTRDAVNADWGMASNIDQNNQFISSDLATTKTSDFTSRSTTSQSVSKGDNNNNNDRTNWGITHVHIPDSGAVRIEVHDNQMHIPPDESNDGVTSKKLSRENSLVLKSRNSLSQDSSAKPIFSRAFIGGNKTNSLDEQILDASTTIKKTSSVTHSSEQRQTSAAVENQVIEFSEQPNHISDDLKLNFDRRIIRSEPSTASIFNSDKKALLSNERKKTMIDRLKKLQNASLDVPEDEAWFPDKQSSATISNTQQTRPVIAKDSLSASIGTATNIYQIASQNLKPTPQKPKSVDSSESTGSSSDAIFFSVLQGSNSTTLLSSSSSSSDVIGESSAPKYRLPSQYSLANSSNKNSTATYPDQSCDKNTSITTVSDVIDVGEVSPQVSPQVTPARPIVGNRAMLQRRNSTSDIANRALLNSQSSISTAFTAPNTNRKQNDRGEFNDAVTSPQKAATPMNYSHSRGDFHDTKADVDPKVESRKRFLEYKRLMAIGDDAVFCKEIRSLEANGILPSSISQMLMTFTSKSATKHELAMLIVKSRFNDSVSPTESATESISLKGVGAAVKIYDQYSSSESSQPTVEGAFVHENPNLSPIAKAPSQSNLASPHETKTLYNRLMNLDIEALHRELKAFPAVMHSKSLSLSSKHDICMAIAQYRASSMTTVKPKPLTRLMQVDGVDTSSGTSNHLLNNGPRSPNHKSLSSTLTNVPVNSKPTAQMVAVVTKAAESKFASQTADSKNTVQNFVNKNKNISAVVRLDPMKALESLSNGCSTPLRDRAVVESGRISKIEPPALSHSRNGSPYLRGSTSPARDTKAQLTSGRNSTGRGVKNSTVTMQRSLDKFTLASSSIDSLHREADSKTSRTKQATAVAVLTTASTPNRPAPWRPAVPQIKSSAPVAMPTGVTVDARSSVGKQEPSIENIPRRHVKDDVIKMSDKPIVVASSMDEIVRTYQSSPSRSVSKNISNVQPIPNFGASSSRLNHSMSNNWKALVEKHGQTIIAQSSSKAADIPLPLPHSGSTRGKRLQPPSIAVTMQPAVSGITNSSINDQQQLRMISMSRSDNHMSLESSMLQPHQLIAQQTPNDSDAWVGTDEDASLRRDRERDNTPYRRVQQDDPDNGGWSFSSRSLNSESIRPPMKPKSEQFQLKATMRLVNQNKSEAGVMASGSNSKTTVPAMLFKSRSEIIGSQHQPNSMSISDENYHVANLDTNQAQYTGGIVGILKTSERPLRAPHAGDRRVSFHPALKAIEENSVSRLDGKAWRRESRRNRQMNSMGISPLGSNSKLPVSIPIVAQNSQSASVDPQSIA